MNTINRWLVALLAGCALLFAFTTAEAQQSSAPVAAPVAPVAKAAPARVGRLPFTGTPSLAKIDRTGVLRVGIAINAPFVMHDKQGQPIGYSVDLAREFAKTMGWKLQLVETSWANLMSGLRSNEYDMIISGVSITPQRARNVLFSEPVGEFDIGVVANRDKFPKGGLAELAALQNARIGARRGSLTADYARAAFPAKDVVSEDAENVALADVLDGKLDAYVAEAPLPQVAATAHSDKLRVLGGAPLARTAHGIVVRPADGSLMRVVNAWIVSERASGWLKARDDYWFKGTSWGSDL